jgi:hypothetical protein
MDVPENRSQGLEPLHVEYHIEGPQHQAVACEDERLVGDVDDEVGAMSRTGNAISICHYYLEAGVALKHDPRVSCCRCIDKIVRRPGVSYACNDMAPM